MVTDLTPLSHTDLTLLSCIDLMSLSRTNLTPLSRLSVLPSLPLSARFLRHACTETGLAFFPGTGRPTWPIGAICLPAKPSVVVAGPLSKSQTVIDLEHAGQFGDIVDASSVDAIGSSRILLTDEHLITTRLRPYLRKTLAVPAGGALASPEWIVLKLNTTLVRPRFVQILLLSEEYGRLAARLSGGKQHPRISEDILHRIEIPRLSLEEQDAVLATVEPFLARTVELAREARGLTAAIDPVFHDAFGLDPALLQPAPTPRTERLRLLDVARSRDARVSWRFNAPEVRIARHELARRARGILGQFLSEPALLGHSVNPKDDYVSGSGKPYVTMAGLRDWRLDISPCPELSDEYLDAHASRRLAEGDVLMARSGEGTIGKVAIVDREVEGCFADFVIRLRADETRLRPAFLRYALSSAFYRMLVFGEKKGLGNNTNVFPSQLHAFPWIEASPAKQDEVIKMLTTIETGLAERRHEARSAAEKAQAALRSFLYTTPI